MREDAAETAREQDGRFLQEALQGNLWKLVLRMGMPLAFYEIVNSLYKILDSLMASHINAEAVSTVAYLAQISLLISSAGQGLATGSSLKISEAYGAGDFALVRRRVSSVYALCLILALATLAMIPAAPLILKAAGTPEELAGAGISYFRLELAGLAVLLLNHMYIATERARGRTRRIFFLNVLVILIKLSLTALFVYVLHCGITMISVASLISQLVLLAIGGWTMTRPGSAFCVQGKAVCMKKEMLWPLLRISAPIMLERAAFSAGKVIVNAMCGQYGPLTVGALGISNTVTGIFSNAQSGIQAGGAALISQNLGGKKTERIPGALVRIFLLNLAIGTTGAVICCLGMDTISRLYASSAEGINLEFQETIQRIFIYDAIGTIVPWGIAASAESFLYGLGKTKLILFINVCRLFVFRVFLLWILQHATRLGQESVGIVMMASNSLTAVLACILTAAELRKFYQKHAVPWRGKNRA